MGRFGGLPVAPAFICQYVGARTGLRCTAAPVVGARYCEQHNGKPEGKAARMRGRQARKLVGGAEAIIWEFADGDGGSGGDDGGGGWITEEERMDILSHTREVDPGVLLIEEISRTAGIIDWLTRKISGLEEQGEFIASEVVVTTESGMGAQGNQVDTTKTETRKQVTHWWTMLERERSHLAQVTTAALRSGIEERRVRLAERSVSALEAAMAFALMELGLDPHNERVRAVVGASLRRALESGVEPGVAVGEGTGAEVYSAGSVEVIQGEVSSIRPVDF